jgi:predicted aldo/keto reductase-like oxidoreductase
LQEDFAAAVEPMTLGEQHEFERVVAQISPGACHLCGACTGQCPAGVQVADIMRHMLYHDGYGDRGRAASFYRSLPAAASASRCLECQACQVVCPWGVAVRSRLERAHAVLA